MTPRVTDVMTPREDALEHLRRRAFPSLPVVRRVDGVVRDVDLLRGVA